MILGFMVVVTMILLWSRAMGNPPLLPLSTDLENAGMLEGTDVGQVPIAPFEPGGAGAAQDHSVDDAIAETGDSTEKHREDLPSVEENEEVHESTISVPVSTTKSTTTTTTTKFATTLDPSSQTPAPAQPPTVLYPPPGHSLPKINPLAAAESPHPPTPLFIGFTRNYPILQQAILSYIASGWPPSEIYIIDNTGTMDSNAHNLLSPSNPFYLPHAHLTTSLGVTVLTTPALLTFSQLQNYFITTATERGWARFFWSHMDAVALSYEDRTPFVSLYRGVLELLSTIDYTAAGAEPAKWALKFFSYDRLTLVNVAAVKAVGAWDTLIPYYFSDCDFYSRVKMAGYTIEDVDLAYIFDVADTLPDPSLLFPGGGGGGGAGYPELLHHQVEIGASRWGKLRALLTGLDTEKNTNSGGRNYWQARQAGGRGEPFWRDPGSFEKEVRRLMKAGEGVYVRKWGLRGGGWDGPGRDRCDLVGGGLRLEDMWVKGGRAR